ncbi:MAG: response regulator transcription factor [Pedobacter sp.]|nr:MAG: response regulator transcription factor [Pedobacter sp.]
MKAILIDDEKSNLENLAGLLARYCPDLKLIGMVSNVDDGLTLIDLHQPDLLFLDIQMGKSSGFDLLAQITNPSFEVIFVTAYDQYGIQAVKFAALDYLLKPINTNELINAVAKAEIRVKSKKQNVQLSFLLQQIKAPETYAQKIALPQQNEIRYVTVTDIIRCEADNNYTFFYLINGDRILVSRPLKEYSDLLKPNGFLRTHQSHLINPNFVKSWLKEDGGMLLMKNNDKVAVSKPNRDYVKLTLGK